MEEGLVTQPDDASTFTFPVTGQTVRAAMVEGKPMFVATEVATILGYRNPREAIIDHCKHAKLFKGSDSLLLTSSPRGINLIHESDVYRLIIHSQMPAAQQFEEWVMEVVLPAIRQDGMYILLSVTSWKKHIVLFGKGAPPSQKRCAGYWTATVGKILEGVTFIDRLAIAS